MSDPHGHGGGDSSGVEISAKTMGVVLVLFVVFVIYFYFNPNSSENFIIALNVIQVISVVAIFFMALKLWSFMKEFSKTGAAIVQNYESKLKHHHEHVDEKAALKNKYALAVEHLNSPTDNEWKTGLIELDNFIRLALLDFGYEGETTLDLVEYAKEKGHLHVDIAEDIAFLRNRLKVKGVEFDFTKEDLQILIHKFEEFKNTIIPTETNNHTHH